MADMHIAYGAVNAIREALLDCIRSVFLTNISLYIACLQTNIVGYENIEVSMRTREVIVGPGNYVI